MDENVVTERLCKVIHKSVDDKIELIEEYIKEIRDAVTEMREIAASNKEILKILMEERSYRTNTSSKIWDKSWFKYVVIAGCMLVLFLAGGAIGSNILDKYIKIVGG